ncbi:MAG: 4Fe-4S binding protein [Thermodesulfobacteriota bacterium]|nr:4Fe-4S binding protein [Thermodesulfobacteriota bacterium]
MADQNSYRELSKLLGASGSKILPKIIQMISDEKEIKILLAAFPAATVSELSDKTGIPKDIVQVMVEDMFLKGLIFFSKKEGDPRYYRVKTVPQFHDSSILWKGATKEFHNLWKEYMENEWEEFGKVIEGLLPKPVVRVIPVGATIESKAKVLAFEDVREIVNQARTLAVTRCTCRVIDGKCGKPIEICIQVNRAADYTIQRGTGRIITKEEAMGLLHLAEKEGLVHIADNRRNVDHIICNCCRDCCMNWRLPNPQKLVAPSRFQALVNAEECIGCQVCLDRCYFDAIVIEGQEPKARINPEKCVGCSLCTVTCPAEAMAMKEVRPPEVIPV